MASFVSDWFWDKIKTPPPSARKDRLIAKGYWLASFGGDEGAYPADWHWCRSPDTDLLYVSKYPESCELRSDLVKLAFNGEEVLVPDGTGIGFVEDYSCLIAPADADRHIPNEEIGTCSELMTKYGLDAEDIRHARRKYWYYAEYGNNSKYGKPHDLDVDMLVCCGKGDRSDFINDDRTPAEDEEDIIEREHEHTWYDQMCAKYNELATTAGGYTTLVYALAAIVILALIAYIIRSIRLVF